MIGRRGFLKAAAALPVAGPAIAAEVTSSAAVQAGIGTVGSISGAAVGYASFNGSCSPNNPGDFEAVQAKTTRWLLANGVPQWMRDNIRREIGPPSRLDPDLAAARSFSLAAKMRMQHERDVERRCQLVLHHRVAQSAGDAWRKATGLNLW